METKIPQASSLLLIISLTLFVITSLAARQDEDPYIGVCIGTQVSNLLAPADLVAFLKAQQIKHIRLYDPDTNILSALSGAGIRVLLGIPNNQLLALGSSPATAAAWVARHVLPFHPSTPISAIAVGDDVPFTLPSVLPVLLPALLSLRSSLSNLSIPISTPLSFSTIIDPFPPSQAFFNQSLVSGFLLPLLRFLSSCSSPLMLNLYPYYVLTRARGVVPLDNALFRPLPPSREEVDPNTLLHYTNVLDAMLDAAYFSMRNLNFTNIPVLITETGWPSLADRRIEPFASKDNADTYNSNIIKHVLDRTGTPLHPELTSSVYIYELFDEDLRPGPLSEQHWGLFYGNATPVYLLHVTGSGGLLANDTTDKTYCVATEGADRRMLQAALDWACGPGRANCSEIQPGETCYDPNTVKAHASYAFNSYYQKEGKVAGSCYFQGVAMITTSDPSHGKCIFPGSKEMTNITQVALNATQTSDAERSCRQWWRRSAVIDVNLLHALSIALSVTVIILTSIP
ncbi:hypothetical protein J5N97_011267 [Dioscorea zingiberensis]|uniref:glucan endo-1,3-beta-D-glucosidase n=1 Tax=Dioscorea zingiberensis TaxID=325984 RepID=A0A9D5HPE2_9LILI|nr:hypothetical protein J5N97_011267 [Dioscorea zingiberensis]